MAHVVLYIAMSLDGFIADAEGAVHWLAPFESAEYGYDDFVGGVDSLIMGRATYDQVQGFGSWPYAGKRVVVMTSRPLPNAPRGVTPWLGDDVGQLVAELPGPIWLVGGAKAVRPFLSAGLVERMQLFVMPCLLGQGIRLFDGETIPGPLPLLSVRNFETGVVRLDYGKA